MLRGRFKQYCDRVKSSGKLGGSNLQMRPCGIPALYLNLGGWGGERRDPLPPSLFPCHSTESQQEHQGSGFPPSWHLQPFSWGSTFPRVRNTGGAFETGSRRLCIGEETLNVKPSPYSYRPASSSVIMGSYLKGTSLVDQMLETKRIVSLIQSPFRGHFSFILVQLPFKNT